MSDWMGAAGNKAVRHQCCFPPPLLGSLQEDYDRLRRLLKSEKEMQVDEGTRGGQQENVIQELHKSVSGGAPWGGRWCLAGARERSHSRERCCLQT